jgi:hypothetical protein
MKIIWPAFRRRGSGEVELRLRTVFNEREPGMKHGGTGLHADNRVVPVSAIEPG